VRLTAVTTGNFLELVDLVAEESSEFRSRREAIAANSTYLSPDSQNALVEAGARCILATISEEVQTAEMYAVITDCCTDMVADNLSVCIRYVAMDTGTVLERFIQFAELSANELDASSITTKILAILQQGTRFSAPVEACVAQASDGASVMSGKENGVQKILRDVVKNPCIFVHCYAHRLNLVLSVAAIQVQCANDFFDLIRKCIAFVNVSIKRKAIFSDLQKIDPEQPKVLCLPDLCEHKWNFRERAISVVHQRYNHLLETLDHIAENGKPDERAEAEGLLKHLKLPANVMLLVLFSDLFSQLAPLSDVLQAESCDLASALQLASSHTKVLGEKREQSFYDKLR
jgi:hypothetical protein